MEKSQRILVGKTEICAYAGIGKGLFPDLITRGFPAVYWGGKWRAHTANVDAWMQFATKPTGPQPDMADIDDEEEQNQNHQNHGDVL